MKQALLLVCWIAVAAVAVFLRFDDLGGRPFHADEATGARITAQRMEEGGSKFDPKHYHGPLLGALAAPLCRMRGEEGWRDMTKQTLRILPAVCGLLLVFVPLVARRSLGDAPVLLAAALLATSPLLVYYSRMFIHEILLVLAGMLAFFSLTKIRVGRGTAGSRYLIIAAFWVGVMYAIKETMAISILAWTGAAFCLLLEHRRLINRDVLIESWRCFRLPLLVAGAVFWMTAGFFYTDAFRNPHGMIDAVRTFFVYETGEGHDKSPWYYLSHLVYPMKSGGLWWYGMPVVVMACVAVGMTFLKDTMNQRVRVTIRFLAWSTLFHFVIYSLIAYKNPWLACLPWAHLCVLAGFVFAGTVRFSWLPRMGVAVLAVFALVTQFKQARAATGRLASDSRNPLAYVPTRRDIESLESWLSRLRGESPEGALEPVAVIGSDYWPLPWYLRAFEKTGYWVEAPEGLSGMPLVFAMPDAASVVSGMLAGTHAELPRGLRPEVPVLVYIRNDIWERWMNR